MHADAHFVRGPHHPVCEDFAWAEGHGEEGFAVVCDGCTGAPHTDVGARLLALAAAGPLRQGKRPDIDRVLHRARLLCHGLGLGTASLCATIHWVRVAGPLIEAQLRGDGVLAARRRDGRLEVWWVEFPSGAPDYPVYRLELGPDHPYRAGLDGWTMRHFVDGGTMEIRCGRGPIDWVLPRSGYDQVAVMSDGAAAFVHGVDPVSVESVAGRLCDFPGYQGRFVARRLARLVGREGAARAWSLRDDIGLAALAWEDPR